MVNIYETEKIIIRYFKIDIYKLYNLKFLSEISGHLYNNFISLAFSYCKQDSCSNGDLTFLCPRTVLSSKCPRKKCR